MRIFYLPSCPYCGIRLGKSESFVVKNKSLYKCFNCEKVSEVSLKNGAYRIIFPVQVFAVSIFVTAVLLGDGLVLLGLALIILDFILFYGISPYLIILKRAKVEEREVSKGRVFFKFKKIFTRKKDKEKICTNKDVDVKKTLKTEDKDDFTDIFSS